MQRIVFLVITFIVFTFTPAVKAQSLLRDAEMEAFLKEISYPIFEAANLTPENVHLYLIHDPSINAFVTDGQNIFIHSGLIMESDNVNQLIGVIAHETCHIACQHRIRTSGVLAQSGNFSILSMVLGAAAIVAGAGDAGVGLMMAGQQVATSQFLSYSRGQESEADLAGAKYLEATGHSGKGMVEFFEKLRHQEILAQIRQDPYVRTHPLNRQRIMQLNDVVVPSQHYNSPSPENIEEKFQRMKAKLAGYINTPRTTLRQYPLSDQSVAARYARVYGYNKALEWDLAIAEADAMIAQEPNNPYLYEIKGQILFENHKVAEAEAVLEKAVALAPKEALILTAYGQALVSQEENSKMQKAIDSLTKATRLEPENNFAWFNLARAYALTGDDAMANLASAERFYSIGHAPKAYGHARRALNDFEENSIHWIRAQDIIVATEAIVQEQAKRARRQR